MRVIFALVRTRESGDPAQLAKRIESRKTPGNKFVRIRLMPDIKDDLVFRGIDETVNGKDDLNGTKR